MGATAYHIAVIEQSSVVRRSFNWITSSKRPFVEYDAVDIDDGLISAVYDLYRHVYGKLGGTFYINDKYALLKYTRWIITVDKTGQVTGFILSREHPCGIKLGLTAAADSKEAKAAIKDLNRKAMNVQKVFGEVSPPLENALKSHVPYVKASDAAIVLGPKHKIKHIHKDGYHYSRDISRIGLQKKVMVGMPDLSGGKGHIP
jgi:hypothetical protein